MREWNWLVAHSNGIVGPVIITLSELQFDQSGNRFLSFPVAHAFDLNSWFADSARLCGAFASIRAVSSTFSSLILCFSCGLLLPFQTTSQLLRIIWCHVVQSGVRLGKSPSQ